MAEEKKIKYKLIKKSGISPTPGSTGNDPHTIYIHQTSETEAKSLITDSKGKALTLGGGSSSVSSLKDILAEGDYAGRPVQFFYGTADPKKGSNAAAIGAYYPSYDFGFGTYNEENVKARTGSYNTWVGWSAANALTTGKNNTYLGAFAGNKQASGNNNTIIGYNSGTNLTEGTSLTIIGAEAGNGLHPNARKGKDDITSISPIFESYLTGGQKWAATDLFNFNTGDNTISANAASILIGSKALLTTNGTRVVGSVFIGCASGATTQYRSYNNLVIGNFNYTLRGLTNMANSVVIGQHINIPAGSQDGLLAIHNSKTTRTDISQSLIYGNFNDRFLTINGKLNLNTTYTLDLVDTSRAKVMVMNHDGSVNVVPMDAVGEKTAPAPVPNAVNKLAAKKLSFVGDSITNFGETSTEYKTATGYAFNDTWVGQLLQLTGGTKGSIDAISGTTMQATRLDDGSYYNVTLGRTELLAEDSDYIFILMGANDLRNDGNAGHSNNLGTIKPKGSLGTWDNNNVNFREFTGAYQLYLEKILKRHAKAEVVLLTPLKAFGKNSEADISAVVDKYADRVIEIAKLYGLKYIDTREVGFTNFNHQLYYSDGLHPNKAGHRKLARFITEKILEFGVVSGGGSAIDGYSKAQVDSKIENIVIGINNLAKGTATPMFSANSAKSGTPQVLSDATGYFVRYTPASDTPVGVYGFNMGNLEKIPDTNKGGYSISMDFRHSHTSSITIWGQNVPPNVWTRLKRENWTNDTDWSGFNANVPGLAIDVRKYKIERGTKATEWQPHVSEIKLGVDDYVIDSWFPWSNDLDISRLGATEPDIQTVLIRNIPNIDNILEVQEFTVVYDNNTIVRTANPQDALIQKNGVNHLRLPEKANVFSARGVNPKRVYIKAILK